MAVASLVIAHISVKQLKLPYITTIGNHDLLTNGGYIYEQIFGKETYSINFKQTKFIIYNNNNWESFYKVPDMDWVENQLTSSSKTHNILLAHIAINESVRFPAATIDKFESLVNANSVKYSINGHSHNPTSGDFGNATTVTVGSSAKKVLCELIINNSSVTHAFIYP